MIKIVNGKIHQRGLPIVGELKDGSTVSGYHLLDEEILLNEGWLPLEDIQPEYDSETQYLIHDGYEILVDKVIKKYKIEEIPEPMEPQPTEIDILKQRIQELESTIDIMVGVE